MQLSSGLKHTGHELHNGKRMHWFYFVKWVLCPKPGPYYTQLSGLSNAAQWKLSKTAAKGDALCREGTGSNYGVGVSAVHAQVMGWGTVKWPALMNRTKDWDLSMTSWMQSLIWGKRGTHKRHTRLKSWRRPCMGWEQQNANHATSHIITRDSVHRPHSLQSDLYKDCKVFSL